MASTSERTTPAARGRRRFLVATGLAAVGAAVGRRAALASLDQARPAAARRVVLDKGFAAVLEAAPGVYATIARPEGGWQATSNGGVVVGREGALLVEGHYHPSGAALEIEVARLRSRAPIRAAVNSHFHFDHVLGNSRYAEEGIPIIGHELTAAKMRQIYGSMKRRSAPQLREAFDLAQGQARSEVERARARFDAEQYAFMVEGVLGASLAYPTELVSERRTIDLGGVSVILEPRPGHTPTDLLITVPERSVVFTGGLVSNGPYPVTVDADLPAWRETLLSLSRMAPGTVLVPGQGPSAGREAAARQLELLDHLAEHARRMFAAGVPLREAQQRYAVPDRFASPGRVSWAFSIAPAIRKHYVAQALARVGAESRTRSGRSL